MKPLSLSPLTVLEVGPPELIDLAAQAGYHSVGIRLHAATPGGIEYPLRASHILAETKRRLADTGLVVLDVEMISLEPEIEVKNFGGFMEVAAELGASLVNVSGDDPDFNRAADHFAQLCDSANDFGLNVVLEFMAWRCVGHLDQAIEVISRAGRANSGVLVDTLHLFRSGGSATALTKVPKEFLKSAHLSDASAAGPLASGLADEARTNRLPPGQGELPLIDVLEVLPRDIPLAVEVPMSHHPPGLKPSECASLVFKAATSLLNEWESKTPR